MPLFSRPHLLCEWAVPGGISFEIRPFEKGLSLILVAHFPFSCFRDFFIFIFRHFSSL
jgi:hypothetical protein